MPCCDLLAGWQSDDGHASVVALAGWRSRFQPPELGVMPDSCSLDSSLPSLTETTSKSATVASFGG